MHQSNVSASVPNTDGMDLQEKQQRSRTRLSRVERGDGSQWDSSSRKRGEADPAQAEMGSTVGQSAEDDQSVTKADSDQLKEKETTKDSDECPLHVPTKPQGAAAEAGGDDKGGSEESAPSKSEPAEDNAPRNRVPFLNVRPWKGEVSGRVPVWDTRTQRILWGNCAPLARNIERYLESHPTMKIWAGEGRGRFAADCGAEATPLESTSVEFQAREFLGSDDGEDSSDSASASPLPTDRRAASLAGPVESDSQNLRDVVKVRIIACRGEASGTERSSGKQQNEHAVTISTSDSAHALALQGMSNSTSALVGGAVTSINPSGESEVQCEYSAFVMASGSTAKPKDASSYYAGDNCEPLGTALQINVLSDIQGHCRPSGEAATSSNVCGEGTGAIGLELVSGDGSEPTEQPPLGSVDGAEVVKPLPPSTNGIDVSV
jgi:hypothetical protein